MKRFLHKALIWLARIAAVLIVLFILLCLEENWRGAREWTTAVQNIRDNGESLDYTALIPPPIPDDQNLAAIPLFKTEIDPHTNYLQSTALKEAVEKVAPYADEFPKIGSWIKGERPDMAQVEKYFVARYQKVFATPPAGLGTLEEVDALCPELKDLRDAALARPLVRFDRDYTSQPPYNRPLGPTTSLIKLVRVLNLHATIALYENKPDVALQDIKIGLRLSAAVSHEPVLVSGLISIGMVSIQLGSIWEGLNRHAWNPQQLEELQQQLQSIDFISDYQLCRRGEATGFFVQLNDWMRDHRIDTAKLLFLASTGLITADSSSLELPRQPGFVSIFTAWLIPQGWFDMCKARGISLYYAEARESIDSKYRRFYPDKTVQFDRKVEALYGFSFPNLLLRVAAGATLHSIKQFAQGQFRIDAADLACALERYHMAKGAYPASLAELTPTYMPGPLLDPITGTSYQYKLVSTDHYLLYSPGWNLTDEGGTTAHTGSLNSLDWDHGDWVWPSQ